MHLKLVHHKAAESSALFDLLMLPSSRLSTWTHSRYLWRWLCWFYQAQSSPWSSLRWKEVTKTHPLRWELRWQSAKWFTWISPRSKSWVYKNESDLSSRLTAQKPLRESFDDALTGYRMTLAALNLELDKLVEPKKGTQEMEFGFQAKTRLVWKESSMKQLLDQTRGQMTSLQHLI